MCPKGTYTTGQPPGATCPTQAATAVATAALATATAAAATEAVATAGMCHCHSISSYHTSAGTWHPESFQSMGSCKFFGSAGECQSRILTTTTPAAAEFNQATFCTACPTAVTTATEGSNTSAACSLAIRGYYFNATDGNAVQCPLATYQDTENPNPYCKPCPRGLQTKAPGAIGVELCTTPPGWELLSGAVSMTMVRCACHNKHQHHPVLRDGTFSAFRPAWILSEGSVLSLWNTDGRG